MTSDLIAAFSQYFELVHANTDELRENVYALRYQVYVLETGFERAEDCLDGKERDEYDPRSDHYLIRHRRSGLFAATARLILSDPGDPEMAYPIERHCDFFEGAGISDPEIRRRLAEISRFAVSKTFKRRVGEAGTLAGVSENIDMYFEEDERRILPHLSLGLFAAIMRMVHTHQVTHCYAVMEPALHRLIGRFGVIFNPIGPNVNYHGLRIPCLGTVDEALPSIKRVSPSVWDLITERGALVEDKG